MAAINTAQIGSESIMAASDYTRGEMEIEAQKGMYVGTMKAGAWGAIITLLMLGYATFTLSIGMPWLVALVVCAGAGIVIGLGMGFGGAWVATIVALSGLALFVQLLIVLFSLAF
ncbi:MAG: aa3-type cytochrome c oxidase subunit IV [Pseudomonadota bacterium]